MNNIILTNDKIYEGNLILVNADYGFRTSDEMDLTVVDPKYPDILLKREAANILQMILEKLGSRGDIIPVSGYRSFKEQTDIYEKSLMDSGRKFTEKFVALPNHSEHQTGLAIDLGLNKKNIDFICPDFPYEGICEEFRKLAPKYGFVERYQKNKEYITGIGHEPWHFRYVGYQHSTVMYEKGLVLEEYIEYVKRFSCGGEHLNIVRNGAAVEIFYVEADDSGKTVITLPDNTVYQISGNNVDGFIVTIWRKP